MVAGIEQAAVLWLATSLVVGSARAATPAPAESYGEIWQQHVEGAVTAQPVRSGASLIVATNADDLYALTSNGGAVLWSRRLGLPEPAGQRMPINCANVAPQLGILSTPVIDGSSGVIFSVSREWDGRRADSAVWRLHADGVIDGREINGWPLTIAGEAQNSRGIKFDPVHSLQRAGLLLLDGHVVVTFAGICDQQPYRGWVAVVNARTRKLTLWTDEPSGGAAAPLGGGIWQSGRPPVSDRPHQFLVESGNGISPVPGPATTPTLGYANSLLRLRLEGDELRLLDRFTPYQGDALNQMDRDFGVGSPAILPAGEQGEELLLLSSKQGSVYLIHGDDLGGRSQGLNGRDRAAATAGPYEAAFGTPAFWSTRSYAFVMGTVALSADQPEPRLRAFAISSTANSASIVQVGASATLVGYGSSSPVITSPHDQSHALVWAVVQPGGTAREAQLRAYDPIPAHGVLATRWEIDVPNASRFTPPAVAPEALYLGTGNGDILALRYPGASAFPSSAMPADVRIVFAAGIAAIVGIGVAVFARRRTRPGIPQ